MSETLEPHLISTSEQVERFMLAGSATFTLVSNRTGARYTYKVQRPDDFNPDRPIWFVKVLTGSDNTSDYSYIGQLRPRSPGSGYYRYTHGAKARIGQTAQSVVAFVWFTRHLFEGDGLPNGVDFYHEGRCGRCNRALTVPSSIETGFGPDCAEALGI